MKKILLLGGNGMVGKNILEHSKAKEYDIYAPNSNTCNLLEQDSLNSVLNYFEADLIIHAAGRVGGIQANINSPYDFLYENTQMGLNVVQAARNNNVKQLLNLGSSCMYPRNFEEPLEEDMILTGELEPTNLGYALGKISTLKMCEFSNEQHLTNYKTLIPCNLYGRHDHFNSEKSHLLASVITKLQNVSAWDEAMGFVEIWGSGTNKREFMYAADFADFIYFAIENYNGLPEVMNVGCEDDHTILEYYEKVSKIINPKVKFYFNIEKPEGMKRKKVDISKQKALGWMPKTNLDEGIKLTYKWYLENKNDG